MSSLIKQQQDFLKSYRGEKGFESVIKLKGLSPERRLAIYHDSVQGSLAKALSVIYPLTWKLIGKNCADAAAHQFIDQEMILPSQNSYDEWTKEFAGFLENYPPTQKLMYLPDFVRMESLIYQAYKAEDKIVLQGTHFAALDPVQFDKLVLEFHPAVHLFSSEHSLDQVLDVVRADKEAVTLKTKTVYGIITRPSTIVDVVWTSKENYNFLSLMSQGSTLIECLEKVESPDFDFEDFLRFSIQKGLFSEIKILS